MEWSDYVYLAFDSPTFLRWKVDILDSRGHQTKARKDGVAGGGSIRYKIQVGNCQKQCSHVVYEIVNGKIPKNKVIDHEDGNELNNHPSNLLLKTLTENNRNVKMSTQNKSGKVGVYFIINRLNIEYAEAAWYSEGKKITRKFSTKKYGRDEAFRKASEIRDSAIKLMNKLGAGYTERHGN